MALLVRIYYNAVFGTLGGLLGWMLFGVFGDKNPTAETQPLQMLIGGTIIGGIIGYFVVSVDAVRDQARALRVWRPTASCSVPSVAPSACSWATW